MKGLKGEEFKLKSLTASTFATTNTKKSKFAEIAMLSLDDYERIKKNSHVKTKEEEKMAQKIMDEQKENMSAAPKVIYYRQVG